MSTYQDYADSVSRILENKGAAEARAKEQGGQLWGSTIANLGQVIPQQVQQAITQNAQKKKLAQFQSVIQQNGGDLEKSLPILMGIDATMAGKLAKDHADVQESVAKVQKIQQDAKKAQLDWSDELWSRVNDEDSFSRAALASHQIGDQVPDHYDPEWVKQKQAGLVQQKQALEAGKPHYKYGADVGIYNEYTGDVKTPSTPKASALKTVTELRIDAANPNSPTRDQSAEILKNMPASETVSSAAEDERYRVIQAKPPQARTPDETAWSNAYEKQKTLGIDASASAATDRQTKTIAAQVAQQARAQGFTESQAGRDRLDKVNQAYHTAQSGVDTLRETIQAAQSGNVTAGAMQSLLTTMATLKAEGFNRINTAEIGSTKDAGSLVQNIEGWFGKATAGQPIPASVQKDMQDYANILEKAAASKYVKDFNSVKQTYGLTNATPETVPQAAAPVAAGAKEGDVKPIPGHPGTEQTYRGGKWIRTK